MPNIIITEGLDTPWELKNTETNITAATNLESINLANQTVGTLAYTASQLFGSLKTEKNNLDKIVDAIELINEEIALYPQRIANWGNPPQAVITDNSAGFANQYPAQVIASKAQSSITDLATINPKDFLGSSSLEAERQYVSTLLELINAKPTLDAAGIDYVFPPERYLLNTPIDPSDPGSVLGTWVTIPTVREGVRPTQGFPGDLYVVRDLTGKPQYYDFMPLESSNPNSPWIRIPASNVYSFRAPGSFNELTKWRETLQEYSLLKATEILANKTGLPLGVTPPVTTVGVDVEKYCDAARYVMKEFQQYGGTRTIQNPLDITMYGSYPPVERNPLDLSKMTASDINKFFQEPGSKSVYYIVDVKTDGTVVFRVGEATPYIKNAAQLTDDIKKALRGEYAEKQILLTQRSTDQTLFVSSITQRYTTFSDMATNLLKTLMNFYNDLARNLRG